MSALLKNLNIDRSQVKPLPEHLKPKRNIVSQADLATQLCKIMVERFTPFVSMTPKKRDAIMKLAQHFESGSTNPDWLNARMNLMTGSILAGIVGWSPFSNQTRTLSDKLWRTFVGNAATRFGTLNEPFANRSTKEYFASLNGLENPENADEIQISAKVTEIGLVRSVAFPFCGMSPDGILTREFKNKATGEIRVVRQLLEFKCPYKRRDVVDHWPAYDLYDKYRTPHVPGHPIQSAKQPVPQYYYTQLMWGGLFLGKHSLESVRNHLTVPTPQINDFLTNHAEGHEFFGADLIDTNAPILFIVWVNCANLRDQIAEPEVYYEDPAAKSKFVRTSQGAIQITEVAYSHTFATWMLETVYDFWKNMYMPRMVMKKMGMLLKGELDVPLDLCENT